MGRLYCIFGKSATGKSTVLKRLLADPELSLEPIVYYTTRSPRVNEINGQEYIFVDNSYLNECEKRSKVIFRCDFHTKKGPFTYFLIDENRNFVENTDYIAIFPLHAYRDLVEFFGEENVVILYIKVNSCFRFLRAFNREILEKKPKFKELLRRFIDDEKSYKIDNLKFDKRKSVYKNSRLKKCVQKIKEDILQNNEVS